MGTCGTPAFMSPEGLGAGHDNVYHGRPADVWAAGATLFCLLYGQLPFYDKQNGALEETMRRIVEDPLKFPGGGVSKQPVPQTVKDLLSKMLEKDPSKRAPLSVVTAHPWVDVNWKNDVVDDFVAPTSADVKESLTLPRIINRVRRSSSSLMARGLAHGLSGKQSSSSASPRPGSARVPSASPRPATASTATSTVVVESDPFEEIDRFFREFLCCMGADR